MTILYGFTRDDGFAIVDTDARVYVYGYPSSDLKRQAHRVGAERAARDNLKRFQETVEFVQRLRAHPKSGSQVRHLDAAYDRVSTQLVAPQALAAQQLRNLEVA